MSIYKKLREAVNEVRKNYDKESAEARSNAEVASHPFDDMDQDDQQYHMQNMEDEELKDEILKRGAGMARQAVKSSILNSKKK